MTAEIPDTDETVPSVRMVETTRTTHSVGGTHAGVVQHLVALGWEVSEETEKATTLIHSLITGTVRHILK